MGVFPQDGTALIWRGGQETVRIEPLACEILRVRGAVWRAIRDDLPELPPSGAEVAISNGLLRIGKRRLTAEILGTIVRAGRRWPPRAHGHGRQNNVISCAARSQACGLALMPVKHGDRASR